MNETQNKMSSQQGVSKGWMILAVIGWLAFIGAVVYGYFYYGPQQFTRGAASGANPLDLAIPAPGSEVASPSAPVIQKAIGDVYQLGADTITVSVPSAQTRGLVQETFLIADDTEFLRRSSQRAGTEFQENGLAEDLGQVTETQINKEGLTLDDQVEIDYEVDEEGNKVLIRVIVY